MQSNEINRVDASVEAIQLQLPVETASSDRDFDAELIRRIDWRFLLPDGNLHHVAYLGSDDKTLVKALEQNSYSFRTISSVFECKSVEITDLKSNFDLVVLRSPDDSLLSTATLILKKGGHLYWEIERVPKSLFKKNSGFARNLADHGFDDVSVNWHRPNFIACREIIPLNERAALEYVFSCEQNSLSGRIKFMFGHFLNHSGFLDRLVPCFSLLARKNG